MKQFDWEIRQVENLAKEGDKREDKDSIVRIKFDNKSLADYKVVVLNKGKKQTLDLKKYLIRLRNKRMAQITRKNERGRDENIKRRLHIMAGALKDLDCEELVALFNSTEQNSGEALRNFIRSKGNYSHIH